MFPAVVFSKTGEEAAVEKATITFFSDDLGHNHQQVKAFKRRILEILNSCPVLSFIKIIKFKDGCSAQFKSIFCNADLCQMMMDLSTSADKDCSVEAPFFASHEGKSDSDTAGSLEKLRAQK